MIDATRRTPIHGRHHAPVYRSDDGRQFVLDDDGEPVYGVWLHPDEYQEPILLEGEFN